MKKTSLITRIAAVTGIALGAFALAAFAGTWTAPTVAPPDGNVPAPINVGTGTPIVNSSVQEKTDSLILDSGLTVLGNLVIHGGTPAAGDVLTAADNNGTVEWASAAAPQECSSDGYMYAIPNGAMDDWGTPGDRLEFYCRNHVIRLCLANDSSCSWRTNIAGDDNHTCNYSAGALSTGVGPNTLSEWVSAPPSLCSGEAPCTDKSAFNTNGTVMAYGRGKNTWYLCSIAHQKTIITTM